MQKQVSVVEEILRLANLRTPVLTSLRPSHGQTVKIKMKQKWVLVDKDEFLGSDSGIKIKIVLCERN